MSKKFYVGNLPYSTTEEDIKKLFHEKGFEVTEVTLPKDRDTGRLRGFGFVKVETDDSDAVIKEMNGVELEGRPLKVDVSVERKEGDRPPRSGGFNKNNRNRDRY